MGIYVYILLYPSVQVFDDSVSDSLLHNKSETSVIEILSVFQKNTSDKPYCGLHGVWHIRYQFWSNCGCQVFICCKSKLSRSVWSVGVKLSPLKSLSTTKRVSSTNDLVLSFTVQPKWRYLIQQQSILCPWKSLFRPIVLHLRWIRATKLWKLGT